MLERPEAAAVGFASGLIIVIVGLIGVSANNAVNVAFIIVGVVLALVSAFWWRLLRRSGNA